MGRSVATDERDRLAEEWLVARHSPEWYIGSATAAEWDMAYAATYVAPPKPPVGATGQLTPRGRNV